jgi:hypothetical protein
MFFGRDGSPTLGTLVNNDNDKFWLVSLSNEPRFMSMLPRIWFVHAARILERHDNGRKAALCTAPENVLPLLDALLPVQVKHGRERNDCVDQQYETLMRAALEAVRPFIGDYTISDAMALLPAVNVAWNNEAYISEDSDAWECVVRLHELLGAFISSAPAQTVHDAKERALYELVAHDHGGGPLARHGAYTAMGERIAADLAEIAKRPINTNPACKLQGWQYSDLHRGDGMP